MENISELHYKSYLDTDNVCQKKTDDKCHHSCKHL